MRSYPDVIALIYYATALIVILAVVLMLIFYWYKIVIYLYALKNSTKGNNFPEAKKNHKFAIIVPARFESKVIRGLLNSIQNQNYNKNLIKVVVGVESLDDPTCQIVKEYGYDIHLKQDMSKKGKGYIVREMIDYINSTDFNADAFMIFDADNLVDLNYLKEMNKALDAGYDVAVGLRNNKNWNSSWVSSCSGLTFLRFSTLENLGRSYYKSTIQLSGTGFYITKKELERLGGWHFFTLTEDLELTNCMAINNTKCTYVSKAIFYDEQPIKFKDSKNQRMRWVKGYSQVNKIYGKKIKKGVKKKTSNRLGCFDFGYQAVPFGLFFTVCLLLVIMVICTNILTAIHYEELAPPNLWMFYSGWLGIIIALIQIYIIIVVDTVISIHIDRKHINMSKKSYIKTILMNPFYIACYVPISIFAYFKNIEWKRIEHTVDIKLEDVKK